MSLIEPCSAECSGFEGAPGGCYDFCGSCFEKVDEESEEEPKECGADVPEKFLEGEETGEDACHAKCGDC
jgi:hypothetical protein